MKKRLVLILTFVIIQLFCSPLINYFLYADFIGPLDVKDVTVKGGQAFSSHWILRQVGANNYRSLTSDAVIRQKAYAIEELYHQRGFYFASCDYSIEEMPEGSVFHVIFKLDEGQRVIIENVDFKGNFFVSSEKLSEIVSTKSSGFFSKKYLIEDNISKDKAVIEDFYKSKGIEAVVSRVEKVFNEESNVVSVAFFISERSLTGKFGDRQAKNILDQFRTIQNEMNDLQSELRQYKEESIRLHKDLEEKNSRIEHFSRSRDEVVLEFEKKNQEIKDENKNLQEKAAILEKKLMEKNEVEDMLTGYLAQERMNTKEKQEEITKLSEVIEKKEQEKKELQDKLSQTHEEIEKQKQKNDALKDKMANFTDMIKNRIQEIDKVNSQLAVVLDETRHAITKELDSIELSTVVITGDEEKPRIIMKNEDGKKVFIQNIKPQGKEEVKLANGRVLIVNKKLNFIVINYGKEHGVEDNMLFGVFRDAELIANIRVIETRDQISAAEIIFQKEGKEISEGDVVSRLEG